MNAPPSVTADLLARLRAMPHVLAVRESWFHGWVEITVTLDSWHWDTWDAAHTAIDLFARGYVRQVSVTSHVEVLEGNP